jgi:hypothetical protein
LGAESRRFESYHPDHALFGATEQQGKTAMAKVRIFKPAKTAMQSGRANVVRWTLEYEPSERREADPLVGWVGSGDTLSQLRLRFDTKEEAVAYAEREGLDYTVEEPQVRRLVPNNYSDNFAAKKWN